MHRHRRGPREADPPLSTHTNTLIIHMGERLMDSYTASKCVIMPLTQSANIAEKQALLPVSSYVRGWGFCQTLRK